MFIHPGSRAKIIAPIPLVNVGKRLHERENSDLEGLRMYFGNCSGKGKWRAPQYSHCMRTVATLQRLGYRNQRDVFILLHRVTVIYTVQVGAEDGAELAL